MNTNWSDPAWRVKPERKKRKTAEVVDKPPMTCDYCGKPFLMLLQDHCVCPPWTIGLKRDLV